MITKDDVWYIEEMYSQICFVNYNDLLQEVFGLS